MIDRLTHLEKLRRLWQPGYWILIAGLHYSITPVLQIRSFRQRIGTELELHDFWFRPFAAFDMIGRSAGVGRPHSSALPARFRIVDAPVHTFGVETHGIGDAKGDELSVHQDFQRIGKIPRGERHVLAQSEDVVLIHPRVIAGLGATRVWHALEL